jgi:ASC-1-like (ASCH) protein
MEHNLKTRPEFFNELWLGRKTFEVRKDDRDFQVGDTLVLREWNPQSESYTGRDVVSEVTYILQGGQFGVEEGYCVLALKPIQTP